MINHISLTAILKEIDQEDDTIRYIEVKRSYKNNDGKYHSDRFPCMMWHKHHKGSLFLYKEGTVVALDGRIEVYDEKTFIIIDAITFMFKNETEVNLRGT